MNPLDTLLWSLALSRQYAMELEKANQDLQRQVGELSEKLAALEPKAKA